MLALNRFGHAIQRGENASFMEYLWEIIINLAINSIDLMTVSAAILYSRQRRLELQCLYGNSTSNNSYKTSFLKKS